jgi:hypothetical protein
MFLTKEQILAADDLPRESVKVPEWGKGGCVLVKTMTSDEKNAYEDSVFNKQEGNVSLKQLTAKLCAATMIDEKGELLFSEEDIEALGQKSCKALGRVQSVAQKLNNITDADMKEMEKNSAAGQSDSSNGG